MTTFKSYTEDALFAHLLHKLDRNDCKTARQIVTNTRTLFALRHDRKPLNIRIIERKPKCSLKTLSVVAVSVVLISLFQLYLTDVYRTSSQHLNEQGSHQTTTSTSFGSDYYPPEEQ